MSTLCRAKWQFILPLGDFFFAIYVLCGQNRLSLPKTNPACISDTLKLAYIRLYSHFQPVEQASLSRQSLGDGGWPVPAGLWPGGFV
jgi:hypothetical protein